MKLDRRRFLKNSALSLAALGAPATWPARAAAAAKADAPAAPGNLPGIVDTNVHLSSWPFRHLKYSRTPDLVAKLRRHQVERAWASTFDALLTKDMSGANARLVEECRTRGEGMLEPFGGINPMLPDWEEDLRRCHEVHHMAGIRVHPSYQGYSLDHPDFARLLRFATERGLIVQIALQMEDTRVQHPLLPAPPVDAAPLVGLLRDVPLARIQLLNASPARLSPAARPLLNLANVSFDIAGIEGVGMVGRILGGRGGIDRRFPAERLLFGSHAPYFPLECAVMRMFESPLNLPQMQAIMNGNARRLHSAGHEGVGIAAGSPIAPDAERGSPVDFALNLADYGLPTREQFQGLRIWDMHYHGFYRTEGTRAHEEMLFYIERLGIERVISLDIGGQMKEETGPRPDDEVQRRVLEEQKGKVSGLVPIDPSDPARSLERMERWIRRGPCVGIKYYGGNMKGLVCSHPNNDPIIRLLEELQGIVYIHTWLKVGHGPRYPGAGNLPGESTPMDVVALAKRFPNMIFVCGHSGGDWEYGVRVVRPQKNVFLEFAGSDPHSGSVDYAVRELTADRIVWGGHGPSRSFSTELSKVLDADLTQEQRMKIFGGNLRRIAAPIFRKKGYPI